MLVALQRFLSPPHHDLHLSDIRNHTRKGKRELIRTIVHPLWMGRTTTRDGKRGGGVDDLSDGKEECETESRGLPGSMEAPDTGKRARPTLSFHTHTALVRNIVARIIQTAQGRRARTFGDSTDHRFSCIQYDITFGEFVDEKTILKWCQQFEDGRTDLTDVERQGRLIMVSTSDMVLWVEDIILSNRRVSIAYIAQNKGISVDSAHSIVCHQLDYRKLCSRWVPYSLSSEQKGARFAASLGFLQRYYAEGNDFLNRIIRVTLSRIMGASLHPRNEASVNGMEIHIIACENKIQSSPISE
ncbi:Protein GVQW3 like protein [Argiope bruennichi]|uniref:Protein GVQW3 like protein n=1 Tax=Argiope bruennichi TaxID=94029 RepID=A0A8T0EGW5_ARGBR|nr:Protein GVQW3 like protein [Argiope bruennichi]